MLRRFFAEGAFNQGFVPVVSDYKEGKSHEEVKYLVDSVAGTLGLILFVITLIGVIISPILISFVAPGFIETEMTEVLDEKVVEEWRNSIPLKRGPEKLMVSISIEFQIFLKIDVG